MDQINKEELTLKLFKAGCVKFGEFTLKSGMKSPIYIDLRILVSYPEVLKSVGEAFASVLENLEFDRIAAVPYAALPLAAVVSFLMKKPWIYTRKEAKDHGIQRPIEGLYNEGEVVVVIDDLITTGASKLEVIRPIEAKGLKVKDVVVLVDREQGGGDQLAKKGYKLHSVIDFSQMLRILEEKGMITSEKYQETVEYLEKTKVNYLMK
ncbi:orotate phosphoribosyltransferase [Candidatus Microgenomates bacterium]|nr:orotate phosphoribosyltransferase [Candidatus Microgenomates bacterium]